MWSFWKHVVLGRIDEKPLNLWNELLNPWKIKKPSFGYIKKILGCGVLNIWKIKTWSLGYM
jgi:hypothetical protein